MLAGWLHQTSQIGALANRATPGVLVAEYSQLLEDAGPQPVERGTKPFHFRRVCRRQGGAVDSDRGRPDWQVARVTGRAGVGRLLSPVSDQRGESGVDELMAEVVAGLSVVPLSDGWHHPWEEAAEPGQNWQRICELAEGLSADQIASL